MNASARAICIAIVCFLAAAATTSDFVAARAIAMSPSSCESLASLTLTGGRVNAAEAIASGAFVPPGAGGQTRSVSLYSGLPSFCRVTATLTPTTDSDIRIEIWLPVSNWNGRLQSVGNGGWAGSISYPALAVAVSQGYAAASTDTGHSTPGASFAMNHPEKLVDYGHRAVHEMTRQAKMIIQAFYGDGPKLSLWNGCSTGGRQGVIEASMYPDDYDAIVAGATPVTSPRLHGVRLLFNRIANRSRDGYIPPEKYPAIHDAALRACDAQDGVKDGVIDRPDHCRFDPGQLACSGADSVSCLTPAQIETARAMYAPVKDPATGATLSFPMLHPGSELGWATLAGPQPYAIALETYRYVVFNDASWDPASFNATTDIPRLEQEAKGFSQPGTNLKPFFSRGGKLLLYHGWSDQQVAPLNSITYFDDVLKASGPDAAGKSIALYLVPGMGHCQGGPGTDAFDKVAAMDEWIRTGRAPDSIVAAHRTSGTVDRTRPLCQYPQVARYKGSGSTDDASNFTCAKP